MEEIVFSRLAFPDAVMPVIETELPEPKQVTLGLAHLRNGRLNLGWLLRETAQMHSLALAGRMARRPSDLRDLSGDRVHCLIEACVITGNIAEFAEDDQVVIDMSVDPSADTGWRSLSILRGRAGSEVRVELVSRFMKRHPTNGQFVPAVMEDAQLCRRSGPEAQRAHTLASRACAWRATAELGERTATCSIPICAPLHLNGCGYVDAGALVDFIEHSEHIALSDAQRALPVTRREFHVSDTLEDGDTLDIQSRSYRSEGERGPFVATKSVLRRRADAQIIGVCETRRGEN